MNATNFAKLWPVLILASLSLAACSRTRNAASQPIPTAASTPQVEAQALQDESKDSQVAGQTSQSGNNAPAMQAEPSSSSWVEELPRVDEQGAVVVEIIPLKLNNPGHTLDFKVSMNTHSVDLSMNLAELATLSTDTGKTVKAIGWNAPGGGHHVSGKLSFPSSVDGWPLLDGVQRLTLKIADIDAPERVFVWEK